LRSRSTPGARGPGPGGRLTAPGVLLALLAAGCSPEPSRFGECPLPPAAQAPPAAHPALALTPRRHELLLAWLGGEGSDRRAWFARSADAGATWTEPIAVSPPGEPAGADEGSAPRLACDLEGRVALAWVAAGPDGRARGLRLARSVDGGRSWSAPASPADSGGLGTPGPLALASSDPGRLLLAWLDRPAGAGGTPADTAADDVRSVRVLRSDDFGATWSPASSGWSHACPRCEVSAGFDIVGSSFVAFRRHEPGGGRDVVLARPGGPPVRAFVDRWTAAACPASGPALTVARDGTLRVAWYTGAPGREGVWFRQGIPEIYDTTATPLAVLARGGLAPVHVATGDAGRAGTLIACDADSAGAGGLTLVRIEASGRRLIERVTAPGVRGALRPQVAASNTSRRAFVAWTELTVRGPRVRMLRWDVGR
jgi:hypothetical protein